MRNTLFLTAFAAFASAQNINIADVESAPEPKSKGPAIAAISEPVTFSPLTAAAAAAADAIADPVVARSLQARDACAVQPDGYGPKTTPDTAEAFLGNSVYPNIAKNAATPQGYSQVFSILQGSTQQNTYMGLYTMQTYDTIKCQQYCDNAPSCYAFNIYMERDPSVDPADACPNPPSITNFKCTLWGSFITADAATNTGQWRNQFHVVIAGSNGYIKNAAPATITSYTGPTGFGGAIDAPLNAAGKSTFIGMKFYTGPYSPLTCASACQATTSENQKKSTTGTYDACNFFNSYVLSKNNVPLGMYCAFYTQPYDRSYATNYGTTSGSDYYGVSQSYGYSLTVQDSGIVAVKDTGNDKGNNGNGNGNGGNINDSTTTTSITATTSATTSSSAKITTSSSTSTPISTSTSSSTPISTSTSSSSKTSTSSPAPTTISTSTRTSTSTTTTATTKTKGSGDDNNKDN